MFAFDKPISVEQAVRTLSAARNMILDGRLRYHRAGLEVPVTLSGRRRKRGGAQLINLSQGGLQVRVEEGFDASEASRVAFALPGTNCGDEGRGRGRLVRQPRKCWHPLCEDGVGDETHFAALAGAAVFCELGRAVLSSLSSVWFAVETRLAEAARVFPFFFFFQAGCCLRYACAQAWSSKHSKYSPVGRGDENRCCRDCSQSQGPGRKFVSNGKKNQSEQEHACDHDKTIHQPGEGAA